MRTVKTSIVLWAAALAAIVLPAVAADSLTRRADLVIGPDDTITISAVDADEISKAWRVSRQGEINLPMVGIMRVAGLTVDEFEKELTRRLRKYYVHPQVNAQISDLRSQPVTVVGPVEKPGSYQLQGAKTLFEVLVMAGGPKEAAGNEVTLTRLAERGRIMYPGVRQDDTGKYDLLTVPVKDAMDSHNAVAEVTVEPYDVITVSEYKPQKMVHIAGEVIKPGAVELVTQDTVSLMKVLAVAGGLTRTASPHRTLIVHLNANGQQTSSAFVDIRKVLKGEARDLDLTAGDIVIVPSNTLMSYVQAASLSAVSTGVYILGRF